MVLYKQGGVQEKRSHPQHHRGIHLSMFGCLHMLENASYMLSFANEAAKQKNIMANDELRHHIPKKTKFEPTSIQRVACLS